MEQLLRLHPSSPIPTEPQEGSTEAERLSGGLIWHNAGLQHEQSASERERNALAARVLNRLAVNALEREQWQIDGASNGRTCFCSSLCRRVFFGLRIPALAVLSDMKPKELLIGLTLLVPTLVIDFWPRVAIDLYEATTTALANDLAQHAVVALRLPALG